MYNTCFWMRRFWFRYNMLFNTYHKKSSEHYCSNIIYLQVETDLIHFSTRQTVITRSGQTRSIKRIAWPVAVVVFVLISTFQTNYYASYAGKKQIWNLNKFCSYTVVLNMAQTVTLVSLGSKFIKISQTGDKLIFTYVKMFTEVK